jgi:CTP synthase (UTP-ammonia lyase)
MHAVLNIALVGDYDPQVLAHQAIPKALKLNTSQQIEYQWIHSSEVDLKDLSQFEGIWCVPKSPYENMDNVLSAIRFAREHKKPFLGTCAGYQHAALEFARNVLGYEQAGNAEVNLETPMPLISALVCRLNNEQKGIALKEGCKIRHLYEQSEITEEFNCGFGVNPKYLSLFAENDLLFSSVDHHGDPKSLELQSHPFFIGTAFQPERSALHNKQHPIIKAFLNAC